MGLRWLASVVLLLLSGCATVNPMAFDASSKSIDVTSKSIALMTLDVSRDDDSRYVPRPAQVIWTKRDAGAKDARIQFRVLDPDEIAAVPVHREYALRMALEPGNYELTDVFGLASAFPFNGLFTVPLFLQVTVPPHAVVYLGHVGAKLRPRKEGEFRAGPLIPLVDQAATGMSGNTWDVSVEDRSAVDLAMFRSTFPALTETPIGSTILPPFDRAALERHAAAKDTPASSDSKTP